VLLTFVNVGWPSISKWLDERIGPLAGIEASIDTPNVDGMEVPYCSTVSGTTSGLSADQLLWLVIQHPNAEQQPGDFWLITPVPKDGNWTVTNVAMGDETETGRPFWIQIHVTDRKITSLLKREDYHDANMLMLPRGFLTLLHERPVRRGAYNGPDCGVPTVG
jgi:hypothetical protein